MSNYLFIRSYFEARREAESFGLDAEESKGYAIALAKKEVSALINSIL